MAKVPLINRTIWIVGASRGVGFQLAKALAAERNFVIVSGRTVESLENLAQSFPKNVATVPLDVTKQSDFTAASQQLREITDHIDILAYCVDNCEFDDGPVINSAIFQRMQASNFLGAVATIDIAIPLLRHSPHRAQIVAVSSLASLVPFPGTRAYGASKAALEYFLQGLSLDQRDQKLNLTIVRPALRKPIAKIGSRARPRSTEASARIAKEITYALAKGHHFVDIPKKVAVLLKLMRLTPRFWLNSVAGRFRKPEFL